jgi:hypothetical protein
MPYQTTSLTRAVADVAARLADPGFVRFSEAEVTSYVVEALRTWNAFTGHFRDQGAFETQAGEPFYDLSTMLPIQCGYSVTAVNLVQQIQAHLLEPVGATWTGSDQFTMADVLSALERRRDQFLLETGLALYRIRYPIAPPPDGRITLDETIISVRRAAWHRTDGVVIPLKREDIWTANHYAPTWVQAPARPPIDPTIYSVGETPPLVLQVVPAPLDTGVLDLVSVMRESRLDLLSTTVLGVPDDWAWVVKFGAIADLLGKDGLAFDPHREAYCDARWQQGIAAARASSIVWAARINNVVVSIDTLTEADRYLPNWQTGTGEPGLLLLAGDLVALTPVPNAGTTNYSVTLDLVRRAPIPPTPDQPLQVGPELLDMLYDYAEHLAMFKEGPDGVTSTKPLLDRFLRMAGVTSSIDWGQTIHRPALTSQSKRDEAETPRMQEVQGG